jgi:hypothetical protein
MALMNATQIPPSPQSGNLPRLAQSMAYTQPSQTGNFNNTATYRLGRGFPFLRRGVAVSAIPQFKGITLYSHTANTPAPFQNSQVGKNITWPIPPK